MIKVDNGKTVRYLARKEYDGNQKRNLLTILAIVLTTFLITTVCSLGGSYFKTVTRRSVVMEGIRYDVSLPQPTKEQVMKAYRIPEIKDAGLSVKCAVIRKYKGKQVKIRLFWGDAVNWEKQCLPAFEFAEGTYPKEKNEVMLSMGSLKELGIENPRIGMELPVGWGSLSGDEKLADCETVFKLTGYYREYTGQMNGYVSEAFYKGTGVKQTGITQGMLYLTLQNSLYSKSNLESLREELGITGRQMLYADADLLSNFLKMIGALGLLLILVFISGYLFIYNILYISITKEVKHYGQLKTLGMTDRQLENYMWWQIFWNLRMGIPLGLLLGSAVSIGIVPMVLNGIATFSEQNQIVVFHPLILVGAALFSMAAVWFGSYQPVQMAGKMSPIEAVRYLGEGNCKRKRRNTKNGGRISHMAWRNVFRDKKQALVVVLSLSLAMTAFLTVSILIQGKSAKTVLNQSTSYDLRVLNPEVIETPNVGRISNETIQKLETVEGVKEIRVVYSQNIAFLYGDSLLKNYFKRIFEHPLFAEGMYQAEMEEWQKNPDYNMVSGRLVGIDESGFELLNAKKNSLDKTAFLNGDTAILFPLLEEISAEEAVGKELTFRILGEGQEENHKVKIAVQNVSMDSPNYYGSGYGPAVVISQSLFEELVDEPLVELVDIDYESSFNAAMDEKIREILSDTSGIMITAKMDAYEELYRSEMRMRVLGNGLCIILAFLAVLNLENLMAISIQNRRKEFAALASIGMTEKQTKEMLILEGLLYAGMSIDLTIVLGIPLAYTIYRGTNTFHTAFQIPILDNIFVLVLILLCCIAIPSSLYKIMQKGSIVEQLRK